METRIQNVDVGDDSIELALRRGGEEGQDSNFRMYIGLGADKLSIDLKFNPWGTASTFRPEWRSMSKTVFTLRTLVHVPK